MARRQIRRTTTVTKYVRVLDGQVVTPVRCVGRKEGQKWNIIGGSVGKDGDSIKGADGRPVPYKRIGELVWK